MPKMNHDVEHLYRIDKPDPAAIFAAACSIRKACEVLHRAGISEAYNGGDEFLRQCMKAATLFETWACAHVDFAALTDVWPYLLEDRLGEAVLEHLGWSQIGVFTVRTCELVALTLALPLKATEPQMDAAAFLAKFPDADYNENCLRDMACPKCGNRNMLRIGFTGISEVLDEGTGDDGDRHWEGESFCRCGGKCDHSGTVDDFTFDGLDDLIAQREACTHEWQTTHSHGATTGYDATCKLCGKTATFTAGE